LKFDVTHVIAAVSWRPGGALARGQAEAVAQHLSGPLDWRAILFGVERHRVPALAYAALRGQAADIPPEVLARLQAADRACRLLGMRHAAVTAKLLKALGDAGVEAMPLKGAWLSQYLHGDVGLRHAKDIDLLVRQADLGRAREVLAAGGYVRRPDIEGLLPTPRQERFLESVQYHETHVHGDGTEVELHWGRPSWSGAHLGLLWQRARRTQWLGAEFPVPDDDMLLLFLCDHGAHHRWFRLKWLGDVAMLLSRREDDGVALMELARRMDLVLPLAQTAMLVERLYGVAALPGLKALAQEQAELGWLVEDAIAAMRGTEEEGQMRIGVPRKLRFQMRLRRRHDWPRLVRQLLISPYDFMAVRLPDALFPLYVVLRPVMYIARRCGR
jgi:hypothetical protein